ncbi:hypothetical protein R1sor_011138 [Riccia sorocarpa]|uniref:Uncharacterized protein n=1 Tax=Riccia sorocarpa TaxID=122646 RepID=A0ABD3I3R6_9MARC
MKSATLDRYPFRFQRWHRTCFVAERLARLSFDDITKNLGRRSTLREGEMMEKSEKEPDVQPTVPAGPSYRSVRRSTGSIGSVEKDLAPSSDVLLESYGMFEQDDFLGIVHSEDQSFRTSCSGLPRRSISGQVHSGRPSSYSEPYRRSVDFSELARRSVDLSEFAHEAAAAGPEGKGSEGRFPEAKGGSIFRRLLRYADSLDHILMILGTLGGIGDGLMNPLAYYITSGLIDAFGAHGLGGVSPEVFRKNVNKFALFYVYLSCGALVASFLEVACWMLTSERQVSRLRSMYLRSILRQDEIFFDTSGANSAEVVNSVTNDTLTIQDAMSEKLGQFIANVSHFVGGFVISFVLVWRLAVVILPFMPLLVIPGMMFGNSLAKSYKKMHKSNTEAATVADHAVSSVRTVYAFVGEQNALTAFTGKLEETLKVGMRVGFWKGLAMGANGINFTLWGFMTWYGSTLVINKVTTGGRLLCAGLSFVTSAIAFVSAIPSITYFVEGRTAAKRILSMIDRIPDIDADDLGGKVLPELKGKVEFRNVSFIYPSRPETPVLQRFSLRVPAGKTVALVGESGSGKSTVISLIERFYDPLEGQVLIDDVNVKWLQLRWLRMQVGLVSQEPALFATTVKENILLGTDGATMEDVKAAAKAANADKFIEAFPAGYDTLVGERGIQMSGGQKQRIAIARAILKNPSILLLDEATSALDVESERLVQAALDAASVGRTTIIVAHRLSTIENADFIAVMRSGKVVELGSHKELLDIQGGEYAALISLQATKTDHDDDKTKKEETLDEGEKVAEVVSTPSSRFERFRPSHSSQSTVTPQEIADDLVAQQAHEENRKLQSTQEYKPPSLTRLLAMSRPDWRQAVWGSVGAVSYGIVQPLYAFFLANAASMFFITDKQRLMEAARRNALIFVALGAVCCIANVLQHYYFADMGERLCKRVKENMLMKILTFEMGWFDRAENSSGSVCSRISSEANVVRSLVADRISLIAQTVAAILFSCILGLVLTWRLASVMIAVTPLTILSYYVKKCLLQRTYSLTRKAQEVGSQIASEAVSHHRTIAAFAAQNKVVRIFDVVQVGHQSESLKRALIAGTGLGIASFTTYAIWAFDYWWGGELIIRGQLSYTRLLECFFVLIATGKMIAVAGSMTSDLAKGVNSVKAVFEILDRKTEIDSNDEKGLKLHRIEGEVEFRSVQFRYPARPDVVIFRDLNLRVPKGKHVAIVGQSGSGKSTVISLIERFYDPQKGEVLIDGHDLRRLHLRTIRAHIALVSQEPTLFAGTIKENILYGKEDATESELVEAAKAANAYSFISSLENGFQTLTGERGVQLSGGQKQRIAIARAIIKNPAILLLDEATSALDTQSEKTVQDALDRIMVGRTTIVVAHRLSTITNCDSIAVIQDGTIVEQGSHEELLRKESGAYAALVNLQR